VGKPSWDPETLPDLFERLKLIVKLKSIVSLVPRPTFPAMGPKEKKKGSVQFFMFFELFPVFAGFTRSVTTDQTLHV